MMRLYRIALALLATLTVYPASAADLWRPKGQPAFVDSNGAPLAGYKLCFFDAGTSNETTVYKDSDAQTVWSQPITLDSGGGLEDAIYVEAGAFKEKLMASDADDCTDTAIYTLDDIPGALDIDTLSVDFAKPETPVLSKATNYTVVVGDIGKVINVDATGGAVTITLPTAATAGDGGQVYVRKTDASANAVTIQTVGADTINGASTATISSQYGAKGIVSNGSIWSAITSVGDVAAASISDGAVTFVKLNSAVYDTDGTLTANSATKLPTQSAVKTYVDTVAASGIKWLGAVRVASTAAVTLATDFENGDTIDGVVLATNDRILVKDQAAPAANGTYVVQGAGAPTRTTDGDTAAEITNGTVYVTSGTANGGTQWTQSATISTLGTDAQTWSLIGAAGTYTADGTTLTLSSTTFSVTAGGIGTTQIATDGVDAAEIAAGAVGTSEIATDGVGSAEIAALAVDSGELAAAVSNRLRDEGEIITFAGTTCPTFSLTANGAAVSRSTYSTLFSAIGTLYGTGDGSTTFNLPDYRGYFLRGWDNGAGNDTGSSARTNAGGGTTGDNVGTKQADQNAAHTHTLTHRDPNNDQDIGGGAGDAADANNVSGTTSSSGGGEARPKNINVLYCIYVGA
jgi:microcystin-dependent protein